MGMPNRMGFGGPGPMNGPGGMPQPPPGMMPPHQQQQGRGMGGAFPFDGPGAQAPPGFMQQHQQHGPHPQQQNQNQNQTSPIGQPGPANVPSASEAPRQIPGHSRQQSTDKERFESAANQPIARPAPIQRPSSVRPQSAERKGSNTDLDDLSKHLGSSALLADDDEPLPANPAESRRRSNIPVGATNGPLGGIGGFGSPAPGGFGAPGSSWTTPSMPFGQGSGLGQQNWGALPNQGMSSWNANNAAFASNSAFGPIGGMQPHRPAGVGQNRPLTIRLAVCQACKQLSQANRGEGDGFHGVDVLLRQIEHNRPPLDAPPNLQEIEEICETEGDSQNGGGELRIKKAGNNTLQAVKWQPDASTPDQGRSLGGLGEIGSPMPTKTSPAGFGAPGMGRAPGAPIGGFQSLGAVGSGSNF